MDKFDLTYIYNLEYPKGNIRYIGKTNDIGSRFRKHISDAKKNTNSRRLAWIKSLLNKNQMPIINVIDAIPVENWQFWEQYYISLFKTWGFKLTNATDGGDGNHNPPDEVREKISKSLEKHYKSINQWDYENNCRVPWNKGMKGVSCGYPKGKIRSEEDRLANKIRKREYYKTHDTWNKGKKTEQIPWNKGKRGVMPEPWNKGTKGVVKAWNKGIRMRKYSKDKMITNNPNRKEVIQFDLNGNFIREWFSCADAQRELNIFGITLCCKKKNKSAGGFLWLFKEIYKCNNNLIHERVELHCNKNKLKARGRGSDNACTIKVVQLDRETKSLIKVWGSIIEAKRNLGQGNISRACLTGNNANGFKWMYYNDYLKLQEVIHD